MNITQKRYPFFTLPILKTFKSSNYDVKLTLMSSTYNGTNIELNTPRIYNLKNLKTVGIENRTAYGITLTQQDFNTEAHYYGFFTVIEKGTNNIIDIPDNELVIYLQEPELSVLTDISVLGERLNYGQALEYLLSKSLSVPFPVTQDKNGKQVFELYTGFNIPFVVTDDETGGALPIGSYIEVYNKQVNRQVPVNGKMQLQLFQSNLDGTPKGFANAEALSPTQVSYTYISDLPKGDYYAMVYALGKKPQAVPFVFDSPHCK